MKKALVVSLALLLAFSVVAMAGGDQNQNQRGKEDGTPGNGDQVKERERPDDPAGECPNDPECPGCPDCEGPLGPNGPGDGDGVCDQASVITLAGRNRDRDGDCEDPDGNGPNGPNGPNGDCDGDGPMGPGGPGDGSGDGDGPFGPGHGDGDGEGGDGPFGPGDGDCII